MSESESEDELRPHQLGRRQFCADFFSDSDDEGEVRDYDSSDGSSAASDHRDGLEDDADGSVASDTASNQGVDGDGTGHRSAS
jgi:hypothetical protein